MISRRGLLAAIAAAAVAPKQALAKLLTPAALDDGPYAPDFYKTLRSIEMEPMSDAQREHFARMWQATRERAWALDRVL